MLEQNNGWEKDSSKPVLALDERHILLEDVLPYYSQEAREILLHHDMTVGKIIAILPFLDEQWFSTEELRLILHTDERAVKGHVRKMMQQSRKNTLTIIQPLSLEDLRIQLYSQLRDSVLRLDGQAALIELQKVLKKVTDYELLTLAVEMQKEKVLLLWEILHEITSDQLYAISAVDTQMIERYSDAFSWMPAESITQLGKREMWLQRTIRNTAGNVAHKVKVHIEKKVAEVETLSVKSWNTLRNSYHLKIHKHTLEAILHYIRTNDSIRSLETHSSSFYRSMTALVHSGKLAEILIHLKEKIPASFFEKTGLAETLREQLLSIEWGAKLLPKDI